MPGDEINIRDIEALRRELTDFKSFESERRHADANRLQELFSSLEQRLKKIETSLEVLAREINTGNRNIRNGRGRSVGELFKEYWLRASLVVGAIGVGAYKAWKGIG